MGLPSGIHRIARRIGLDLTQLRFADSKWAVQMRLLQSLAPDVVVDVGANSGQFALALRLAGYSGPLVSIEPVSDPFRRLAARASKDPHWTAIHCALGAHSGTSTINVSANSMSSSLLPMNNSHVQAAPESTYLRTERVLLRRLDQLEAVRPFNRIFCKIDAQGYEHGVLQGFGDLWSRMIGVQLETSHIELYEGTWLHADVMSFFQAMAWEPVFVDRGFTDFRTGRMLQSDWTFAPVGEIDKPANS